MDRKKFLKMGGMAVASAAVPSLGFTNNSHDQGAKDLFFDISLAEWSFHNALFNGDMDHLDFPSKAKKDFDIGAVEYVNQFFADKAKDTAYLNEMNTRCDDLGVNQVLIMIDGEGDLAVTDEKKRMQAVQNHHKWVEAAKHLGCFAIRVNARGQGTPEDQKSAAVDSLGRLSEFANNYDMSIIVENHGGLSSNGKWLASVMQQVDMDNCGTLPDLGNFCLEGSPQGCKKEYDRYKGVREMMPFAKDVSAKTYAFKNGKETTIDYKKMVGIIKDAGYKGHIGIEYEGSGLSEDEGVRATKELLKRVAANLS